MPEVWAGELGEFRATSTADGGTALTTTAGYTIFPAINSEKKPPTAKGHIFITPRNFATAVVAKIAFNPWLTILETNDGMATEPTDYSVYGQDGSATTDIDLDSFDTLANGDFLLVGSHIPFRGVYVDVDDSHVNDTASVLTVSYWGGSWIDIGDTDGTITSSKTMTKDATVAWTIPTAWQMATIEELYPQMTVNTYYRKVPMYWTRWEVDTALDSDTLLDGMVAMNRSTNYGELISGQCLEEKVDYGFNGLGCIEALTNAGTANLIINVATIREGEFD